MDTSSYSVSRLQCLQNHLLKTPCSNKPDDSLIVTNPTPFFSKLAINRPGSLNALTEAMMLNLLDLADIWNKSQTKVVWFYGKGGKAFCSGGDIKALYEAKFLKDSEKRSKIHDQFFRQEYICDYKLKCLRPVQISVLDGIVMGGGVGISIHSKIRIATEATVFAMPEAKIGLFTDVSGSYFLSRLPNNLGMFLALTGTRLRGAEMVQAGLANFFVRRENLDKLERDLQENVEEQTTEHKIFEIVNKYSEKISEEYPYIKQANELFSGQSLKEIYEKLRNDNKFKDFSQKMLKIMNESSPSSLRIIFEGLKRGENMTLEEAYKMEFRLTQRFMNDHDFFEGVRCTLVDKKDKPKWKYNNPFEMDDEEVKKYFSKLPNELELRK